MTRAAALWTLLALFTGRVLGQLAVALDVAPFLPPMDEWQSGLLPYPVLLAAQVVLLAGLGTICWQFSRGRGWFFRASSRLGTPLWIAGWIYAASMVVRYVVWMTIRPEERWTGDLIPVVFHVVLASFLLVVAGFHREGGTRTARAGEAARESV
jgi:hypothetical protein